MSLPQRPTRSLSGVKMPEGMPGGYDHLRDQQSLEDDQDSPDTAIYSGLPLIDRFRRFFFDDHLDSHKSVIQQILHLLRGRWIYFLLPFAPLAIIAKWIGVSDAGLFLCCFLGLVPLAALLCDFTELLATNASPVVAGLINVSLGNIAELIVAVAALRRGLFEIIKWSMMGSIMNNLLLVLGSAVLFGGLIRPPENDKDRPKENGFFRKLFNRFQCGSVQMRNIDEVVAELRPLLLFAVFALCVPATYGAYLRSERADDHHGGGHTAHHHEKTEKSSATNTNIDTREKLREIEHAEHVETPREAVLRVSRIMSVFMVLIYAIYVFQQLMMARQDPTAEEGEAAAAPPSTERHHFSMPFCAVGLSVAALIFCILSDDLVRTITPTARSWNLPQQFMCMIVVPFVGNTAEQSVAIVMAIRNHGEVALSVSIGSAVQVALFVLPSLVLTSAIIGKPLDLDVKPFAAVLLLLTVLLVTGQFNYGAKRAPWLQGAILLVCYVAMASIFLDPSAVRV